MKPVEVLSQQDQLPNSEIFENNFSNYFHDFLEKINVYEDVKQSILGESVFCQGCSQHLKLGNDWRIHVKLEELSQTVNSSIDEILIKLLNETCKKHSCSSTPFLRGK